MNAKTLTGFILCLVLGLGLGYVIFDNSTALYQAQREISTLESQLDELETDFFNLEQDYVELTDEYDALLEQFSELRSNNVAKAVYDNLESQYSDLMTDYDGLEANLTELQSQYDELDSQYQDLSSQYDELLKDYQLVNSPQSAFTTLDDLSITLTIDKTVYNYTEPIFGNVSIYYTTGEPFEGRFSLNMAWDGASGGKGSYNIKGDRSYSILPPNSFSAGPGVYTITVAWLKDNDGYYIHTGSIDSTAIVLEAK